MRSAGEIIMDLVESGLDDAQKALVLELAALATAAGASPEKAAKSARNARYYQARKLREASEKRLNKASETRLNKATETPENVLIQTPLARVEDNNPLTEDYNYTLPDSREADVQWPESEAPSRADLDRLESALREAAGVALNAVATALFDLSPILRLAKSGQGPPCDLHADVLPIIRARAAKALPGSVKSWAFFVPAITEARDRRLSGAPVHQLVPPHERRNNDKRQSAYVERLQDIASAMAAAG